MNHPDNADRARKHLEVHRIGKTLKQHASQAATYDRILFRCRVDAFERALKGVEKIRSGLGRAHTIPLKGLVDFRLRATPNDERAHLPKSGAELVAKC